MKKALIPLMIAAFASSAMAGRYGQYYHGNYGYNGGNYGYNNGYNNYNHGPRVTHFTVPMSGNSLSGLTNAYRSKLQGEGYTVLGTKQEGSYKTFTRFGGKNGGAQVVITRAGQYYKIIIKRW